MDLVPKIPAFLDKQSQLSTEDTNKTRLVTSIFLCSRSSKRPAQELESFKQYYLKCPIPYIGDYVTIVCAIVNAFHPSRLNNIEDDNVIVQRMLDLVKKPNYLQQTIAENGWARKRAIWVLLSDSDLPDFPRLTWKKLQYLIQLKQSRSNTHEHLNQLGLYYLHVNREDSSVARLQLRSRHTR
ncbi:DDE Tnp4 domain-containing protein [Trichonephila clavipes]|nr:DDE Tnp4 domain-containing protein [Trichonephila clavipes]